MSSVPLPRSAPRGGERQRSLLWLYVRRIDWLLIGAVLAVATLGLDVLGASASHTYFLHQELHLAAGIVLMVALTLVDTNVFRRLQWPIYGLMLLSLLVVLPFGAVSHGAVRWISLGFFQLQPSEFGKLALALSLAAFLADRRGSIGRLRVPLLAVVYAGVPALLVFQEPDFGTAMVYGAILLAALFVGGMRLRHLALLACATALLAALVLVVLPAGGVHVVKSYQIDRLTAFMHPSHDPAKAGWNQAQSLTAVGSGGVAGRGVENATQTRYGFLPEHHTDFIFAVVGEQRGFIGAALLLGLYLVVIWRALRAVAVAETYYASLVAAGIAGWFLVSIFVNIGMTIGIAPITGIPLPLVSYGGSSTITVLCAIGILQSIQLRGRLPKPPPFEARRTTRAA
jgi:rod shape determining protein RodA